MQHQVDENSGHVAIRIVVALPGPDDIVRNRHHPLHAVGFGNIGKQPFRTPFGNAVGILRSRHHLLGKRNLICAIPGHGRTENETLHSSGRCSGNNATGRRDNVAGDQMRAEYGEAFIGCGCAMVDDIDVFHQSGQWRKIIAVDLMEHSATRNIVKVATRQVVTSRNPVPFSQAPVRNMAP